MTSREVDTAVRELASRQFGVFTLDQARSVGVSSDEVRRRVRAGALVRVDLCVYRLAGALDSWDQRAIATVLATGEGSVLCGRSAATVWRLDLPRAERIEVAKTSSRRWRARSDRRVVHCLRVEPCDRTHVGVFPVTKVARTLVDLAAVLEPPVLARVVDDALSRRLVRPDRLDETARRLVAPGRKGVARVCQAVAPWLGDREFDSVAEAACDRLVIAAGLPEPARQYLVAGTFRVDFAWPDAMVVLEVDGFRWHANARSHAGDIARANALAALGWTVLRTTPTELADTPTTVMSALRRRLLGTLPAD